ncbi:MAG: hypothetical protein ACPGXZ_00740 [Saprospiraceae bacterium]
MDIENVIKTASEKYGVRYFLIVGGLGSGKSTMIFNNHENNPLVNPATEHERKVSLFYPARKNSNAIYKKISEIYQDEISYNNKLNRHIRFNKGSLKFWSLGGKSMQESGRGYFYDRIIYDNSNEIIPSVFEHHLEVVAKPLLLENPNCDVFLLGRRGEADSFFHHLARRGIRTAQQMAKNEGLGLSLGLEAIPLKDGKNEYSQWLTIIID